jgi:hypothetical protein
MSFMMEIDAAYAAQRTPLDLLVANFNEIRSGLPSISFCRQVAGVPDSDEAVARRLRVAISTVRGWRDVGRRASSPWACQ